jgi:hypothetical protein
MHGRFHIYLIKSSPNQPHIESRSLCPECALRPRWRVQEVYELNGGIVCSGCGIEPLEYTGECLEVAQLNQMLSNGNQPLIFK